MASYIVVTEAGNSYTYRDEAAYSAALDWYNDPNRSKSELLDYARIRGVNIRDGYNLHSDWTDILMEAWARENA